MIFSLRHVFALVLVLAAAVGAGTAFALDDPAANETEVNNAIDGGAAYLLTQQGVGTDPGCWTSSEVVTGVSALAMLSILNSQDGGYASLDAPTQDAIDAGTACLLDRVQTDGTIVDFVGELSTYNTSIAIWALSSVPSTPDIASAIAGGRAWLLDNQYDANTAGVRDTAGELDGGWYYEGGSTSGFVEHSNSSFAMQALAVTGGLPAANADLAQGFFTCLQNRLPVCANGDVATGIDGGFIYSHQLIKGGSRTSQTGSGVFAMRLAGVGSADGRITDGIAFLDEALNQNPCNNMLHADSEALDDLHWSESGDLIHYAQWAATKAYELAGVADDVNDTNNWFYKLANCLVHEQEEGGSYPASDREDAILATSFALLTLERVTPVIEPTPTPTSAPTATATPSPIPTATAVAGVSQLPATGGTPSDGASLPWLAIAAVIAITSGGLVLAYRTRRAR